MSMASSHDGTMIASSCKASNPEHAVVRVHSTTTWDPVGSPLAGHTLGITRIAFSKDDQRILSVSRDRGWRLFCRNGDGGYEPEAQEDRAHARMVLDASWGRAFFATAGRDKSVSGTTHRASGLTCR
jgi:WD40 repeat protein